MDVSWFVERSLNGVLNPCNQAPPSPEVKPSRATKKPVKAPWEEADFVRAIAAVDEVDDDIVPLEHAPEIPIPVDAVLDPVVTDDDPIVSYDQISQEDHATGEYEEHLVPTKVIFFPYYHFCVSILTMISITADRSYSRSSFSFGIGLCDDRFE